MLVLFLITSSNYKKEKIEYVYASVNQANHQTIHKIDDYIDDISNITKIPLTYKQMDDSYMNELDSFNQTGIKTYTFQQLNEQIFEEIMTYKKSVNSCFIFNVQGDADYKVKYAIYNPYNPSGNEWFQDCIDAFGKPVLIDTHELTDIVDDNHKPLYVFGVARGIVQLKDATVIGVLLVNTEVSYLENLCNDMKLTENHRVIILHDDYTIYDTNTDNIGNLTDSSISSIPSSTNEKMYSIELDGQKILASSVISDDTNWRIISLIPEKELFYEINIIQTRNVAVVIIIMTVSLVLLFYATTKIVKPLNRLSKVMKIAESGDFNTHVQVESNDEVGKLAGSYNSLIDKINELIHEVYIEKINTSEMELQMLQSQINPHFLYNTLESISMMATLNDDEDAAEMASLLGSLLRYSISNIDQQVTLSDELNQLNNYIKLQAQRFQSQYQIEVNIDSRYYTVATPKLILQPVVENAIYHGMATVRSGGLITIKASQPDSHTLLISVTDNGEGMSEQKVTDLNGYIHEENNLFNSIGLRNVNRRIQLFCGPEYGINVESTPNIGTTVNIRMRIHNI